MRRPAGSDRGVETGTAACIAAALLLCAAPAAAGPPFAVDDPGTVEEYNGTFLLRYELVRDRDVNTHAVPAATLTLGLPAKLEFAVDGAVLKSEAAGTPSAGFGDWA